MAVDRVEVKGNEESTEKVSDCAEICFLRICPFGHH